MADELLLDPTIKKAKPVLSKSFQESSDDQVLSPNDKNGQRDTVVSFPEPPRSLQRRVQNSEPILEGNRFPRPGPTLISRLSESSLKEAIDQCNARDDTRVEPSRALTDIPTTKKMKRASSSGRLTARVNHPGDMFGDDFLSDALALNLWTQLCNPATGIKQTDHIYKKKTYRNTFTGQEVCNWLFTQNFSNPVSVANQLMRKGFIIPVTKLKPKDKFQASNIAFYQLKQLNYKEQAKLKAKHKS